MKRHRFDPVSFIFGVTFLGLTGVLAFTHRNIGERWLAWGGGALLIAIGLAMVFGSRRRIQNGSEDR